MKEERKIATKKFINFIKRQPPDRPVDMDDNRSDDACGCVMVHYGKEVLKWKDFRCGMKGFYNPKAKIEWHLEKYIDLIIPDRWDKIKNYGDIQKLLKN